MDNFKPYENDQYNQGIELEEYDGTYSLVLAQKGNDENVYKKWCFPEYKKKPIDKSVPWKIPLGNSEAEAIETLQYFIELLGGGPQDDVDMDPDLPF